MSIQRYGWTPDIPDIRDYKFSKPDFEALPPLMDLSPNAPAVVDQGQLGSCTANAIANCYKFVLIKEKKNPAFIASRLFIYYNERKIEGTIGQDSGAMIRDGFKSVATDGVCSEVAWPYNINKFTRKPTQACYKTAKAHTAIQYNRLDNTNLAELKSCIASGFPFVFGFSVYDSFESQAVASTGTVPMPSPTEKLLGGHAVLAMGYNDSTQRFLVMNSWGTDWGVKGYFTIPYAYLTDTNLADDFWTLKLVK